MDFISDTIKGYMQMFGVEPELIVSAPGRINIIGEHTDYNDGYVLPAAINKAIYIAAGKRTDYAIKLFAASYNELFECALSNVKPISGHWSNYISGPVAQLNKAGYKHRGFNFYIFSDLPVGAGVSSSAALESGTLFALNQLFKFQIEKLQIVQMAQWAEHEFAGVQCGIMDMFASVMGKKDTCFRLDCRSLEFEYVPLQLKEYRFLLLNTNVKHSLAFSAYNQRRMECAQGIAFIQETYPQVKSLRDVSEEMLNEFKKQINPNVDQRCRFVVREIQRVLHACTMLEQGNLKELGMLMYDTHNGLSNDYEVSCDELDFLVNAVRNQPGVLGARMMGGGFGGCTINLVHEKFIEQLQQSVGALYESKFSIPLTSIEVISADGVHLISSI